jgi:hypothetical protein
VGSERERAIWAPGIESCARVDNRAGTKAVFVLLVKNRG